MPMITEMIRQAPSQRAFLVRVGTDEGVHHEPARKRRKGAARGRRTALRQAMDEVHCLPHQPLAKAKVLVQLQFPGSLGGPSPSRRKILGAP